MEAQNPSIGHSSSNGYASFSKLIPGSKVSNTSVRKSNARSVNKSALIDGGKFDWRLAFWWVAGGWILFTYTQSVIGVWIIGAAFGLGTAAKLFLAVSVSAGEGIVVAWLTCPQRSLVSKRQERYLRIGSYLVTTWQIIEIGFLYAYQLGAGDVFLWVAGMSTVAMLATAVLAVKFVIQHSEQRLIALEESDTRLEESVANATLKSMEARHRLQAKKSIIDIEAQVLRREKMQALNALDTKEAREGISKIGQGRAQAVIQATAQNMQNYAVKMLLDGKPKNAPVNPRALNGSREKKS